MSFLFPTDKCQTVLFIKREEPKATKKETPI